MRREKRKAKPEPLAEELLASPRPDEPSGPAFTQYLEGDGATGGNTSYGNTSRNTGMRLSSASPWREHKEGE